MRAWRMNIKLPDRSSVRRIHQGLALGSLVLPAIVLVLVAREVTREASPGVMTVEPDGRKFGLTLDERLEIFRKYADHDPRWKKIAQGDFPTHEWSQADHYHSHARSHALFLARKLKLHPSQVFMVADEGIHEKWPGKDGKPVDATIAPLDPRPK